MKLKLIDPLYHDIAENKEMKNIESQKTKPNRLNKFLSLIKLMRLTLAFFIASVLDYGSLNLIKHNKVCIGQRRNFPMQTTTQHYTKEIQ